MYVTNGISKWLGVMPTSSIPQVQIIKWLEDMPLAKVERPLSLTCKCFHSNRTSMEVLMPNFVLPSRFQKSSTYIDEHNTSNILLMLGYWLFGLENWPTFGKCNLDIKCKFRFFSLLDIVFRLQMVVCTMSYGQWFS